MQSRGFPTVAIGYWNAQAFTMSETNGGLLSIGTIALSGPDQSQFRITSDTCSGATLSMSPCTYVVAFVPTSTGAKSATISTTSNASALSGALKAEAPLPHRERRPPRQAAEVVEYMLHRDCGLRLIPRSPRSNIAGVQGQAAADMRSRAGFHSVLLQTFTAGSGVYRAPREPTGGDTVRANPDSLQRRASVPAAFSPWAGIAKKKSKGRGSKRV